MVLQVMCFLLDRNVGPVITGLVCLVFRAEDVIRGWEVTGVHLCSFFFQAEDGIRDYKVTGVQTCALPIFAPLLFRLLNRVGRHERAANDRGVIELAGLEAVRSDGIDVAPGTQPVPVNDRLRRVRRRDGHLGTSDCLLGRCGHLDGHSKEGGHLLCEGFAMGLVPAVAANPAYPRAGHDASMMFTVASRVPTRWRGRFVASPRPRARNPSSTAPRASSIRRRSSTSFSVMSNGDIRFPRIRAPPI